MWVFCNAEWLMQTSEKPVTPIQRMEVRTAAVSKPEEWL